MVPIKCDRREPSGVFGVEMRAMVIGLLPVHVDDDPEERTDTRHETIVAQPTDASLHLARVDPPPHLDQSTSRVCR